ncbi:uncharacterized protein F5147DRAFT_21656 [Suillus discolor]|uniref:Uncharacterized protein n=1 Tax=Suillus discolor TaxID=1912936 RepID=A0A9P7JXH9_9AGAM|nr:uncharacterized protein F5147DRAFT_21656 [Suillus discolor]KAG2114284.1 hypothetical protein F5147DRAFT_21656 [Suillus discolor]
MWIFLGKSAVNSFSPLLMHSYSMASRKLLIITRFLTFLHRHPHPPESQSAAINAITSALRLPTLFNFDPLFKLDAVVSAKYHEPFSSPQVF